MRKMEKGKILVNSIRTHKSWRPMRARVEENSKLDESV